MSDGPDRAKADLLGETAAYALESAAARVAGDIGLDAYVHGYFDDVPADDLIEREPRSLAGLAGNHLRLARRRRPAIPNVAVFTPTVADHGWQSPHTAVDVVTDDMPFIVSSLLALFERRGQAVHLLVHPVLAVERDEEGRIVRIRGEATEADAERAESFVHLEIDRVVDPTALASLRTEVLAVLRDVRAAVTDGRRMHERAQEVAEDLAASADDPDGLRDEFAALLTWMSEGNFVFLGYREYVLTGQGADAELVALPETGLGILRDRPVSRRRLGAHGPEVLDQALDAVPLVHLTKTNATSTVHRPGRMDYVGVKVLAGGRVVGERRFVGLWTASAYTWSVQRIPVLRAKARAVIEASGALPGSHQANQLLAILERYPRDELFQIDLDDLVHHTDGILALSDRRLVRLFVRRERYGRYWSALVFVPRDRFDTRLRLRIQDLLQHAFRAERCSYTTLIDDSPLARLHITLLAVDRRDPGVDLAYLEHRIARMTRSWTDDLQLALVERHGEGQALTLCDRWAPTFPAAYREDIDAAAAVDDVDRLEALGADDVDVKLYKPLSAGPRELRLKVFRTGEPLHLSDVLPLLGSHGLTVLDERPYELRDHEKPAWIYDFGLVFPESASADDVDLRARFEASFVAAWRGETESDGLNRLVVEAGLDHRQVLVARAYRAYLHQLGVRYRPTYFEETLIEHADLMRMAVALFRARLDPANRDDGLATEIDDRIEERLSGTTRLDTDRILRGFRNVILATTRTNFYRLGVGGRTPPYLSFKLDTSRLPESPRPRPAHEIFVYSPRMEGVHLRMGDVARGGIRWSDRREDFRTEILGLVKAQEVKNAVIVPVGAKGGFVAKRLPADPVAARAEVEDCYEIFIEGLLDVTDNLVAGKAVPPPTTVRRDGDDPYLVVAADRGTATFSDVANFIATRRGYWLGDAFASGGSSGYDHKRMGITARGAWVSVVRHLRELGIDPDRDAVTAVGIGDMSGDVFGNGMLLSSRLRLVAAFDHRHVFVDPDPDPARAFEARRRLFELPGSTWADYDRDALSAGGIVVERTAKSVALTEQVKRALAVEVDTMTPTELVRAVLRAPVDLLWNGGVGTYVKCSHETHEHADDRANDGVRVNADELRCRVVGEGGNLGFTQLGRVEFAARGGRINTDFIDNSAGVDCSDHEVNIKILLDRVVADGDITEKQRAELLEEMTGAVADLVLTDNADQTLALSLARALAPGMLEVHLRQMAWLERVAGLDRALDGLPSDESLRSRDFTTLGLTQPELAVVLAHTKRALTSQVLDTGLPDDPTFAVVLHDYFPTVLGERFPAALSTHPLRRELVTTSVVNRLVNRSGISMAFRLLEETSASIDQVVRAFDAAWSAFDLERRWTALTEAEGTIPATALIAGHLEVKRLGERATRWFLRNRRGPIDVVAEVQAFEPGIDHIRRHLDDLVSPADEAELRRLRDQFCERGLPEDLAAETAAAMILFTALDVVDISRRLGADTSIVARTYYALDDGLDLGLLRRLITTLPRRDRWSSLARSALRDDLLAAQADLTNAVLDGLKDRDVTSRDLVPTMLDEFLARHWQAVDRWQGVTDQLRREPEPHLEHLSVTLRELRNLIQSVGADGRSG